MKEKLMYTALVLVFIILVLTCSLFYLFNNYTVTGSADVKKKYYDIKFSNVTIDYETDMTVKLDNDKNIISVKIPNLNNFRRTNSFSIDVTNIGNINAKVVNYLIENISTNIDTRNVNIDISLGKDDIIEGGKTNKLIIRITYNGKDLIESPYYEFNIKYNFDEVIL